MSRTVTFSGWTFTDGDAIDTVNGNKFLIYITVHQNSSYATVKALQ